MYVLILFIDWYCSMVCIYAKVKKMNVRSKLICFFSFIRLLSYIPSFDSLPYRMKRRPPVVVSITAIPAMANTILTNRTYTLYLYPIHKSIAIVNCHSTHKRTDLNVTNGHPTSGSNSNMWYVATKCTHKFRFCVNKNATRSDCAFFLHPLLSTPVVCIL